MQHSCKVAFEYRFECFFNEKVYFKERSYYNLLSNWRRFLTYDICLYDISEHLWFYTPCSIHSTGNLDAQYVQLQHVGIYQSSSWRFFGKPGNARVLLLLLSPAPSSQRSGRPALGERKSSRGLIGCSAFIDSIQIWHRYAQHKCGSWEHFLFWSVFHTSDKEWSPPGSDALQACQHRAVSRLLRPWFRTYT